MTYKANETFGFLAETIHRSASKKGIACGIENLIKTGGLPPGTPFPESRELANLFKVSVSTIQTAMNELTHKGLVWRKSRVGTFVADWKKLESPKMNLPRRIAFIADWAKSPSSETFFKKYFATLLDVAQERNYEVVLKPFDVLDQAEESEITLQNSLHVEAIIISSPSVALLDRAAALVEQGNKVLVLHAHVDNPKISCIYSDNREVCREATEHLISLGHRRICLLFPAKVADHASYRDRLMGVQEALAKAQLPEPLVIQENHPTAIRQMVEQNGPDRITGIIDFGLSSIFAMMDLLHVRVPEDMSVISYDQAGKYTHDCKLISAIDQPLQDMITKAFDFIPQLGDGSFQIRLRQRYLPGQTVGPVKI